MMAADEMDLRDEDRLPWLETVEPDEPEPSNTGRTIALVVLGLGVLAAVVFGIFTMLHRGPTGGDGTLIAAQEGDYKVRPNDPGGLKVNGEGDAAVATSAGAGAGNGNVDLKAVPEAPVSRDRVAAPAAQAGPGGRNSVSQVPVSGGRLVATPPMGAARSAVPGANAGGALIQLGAYPSEAVANASWGNFSKRFGYLSALGKSVEPVERNGKTLYRLRVNAGSAGQAADLCGRLRVAGESCFVTS